MDLYCNDDIHIAIAADNNYAQHAAVLIASILTNTKQKEKIKFHLLSDGIGSDKIKQISDTALSFGSELFVYDLSSYACFDETFISGHISRAAYFRLAIANILPEKIKKIIYLDVDMLVLHDISELWNTDLHDKPMGAVPDYGIMASARLMNQKHEKIGLPLNSLYFNSGVVVMDLEKWRKHGYVEQVIKFASGNALPHHDQDALNKIFMSNWEPLALKWNVIPPIFNLFVKIIFNKKFRNPALKARKAMSILHYAGRYKPWEFECKKGFNDKYYLYLARTKFAMSNMPQPSKNMKGKSLTRQLIRLKIADFWERIFNN